MSVNKYFNQFKNRPEQNLLDDLTSETIRIHGIDCVYLPRTKMKVDHILNEDVLSQFDDSYAIEVYIKSVDGFEGQQTLMSKFGVDIKDQITFTLSRSAFNQAVGTELLRPNEGDLIYFPLTNALFEIRFVEHESVFYNLGERYVYDLKCEQFAFSNEDFKTGIDAVDSLGDAAASKFYLQIGTGTGTFDDDNKELLYQGSRFLEATARAKLQRSKGIGSKLEVSDVWGVFDPNAGPVKGNTSGASYTLVSANPQEINNPQAENANIESAAGDIIDFTENNPFSEDF